MPYKIKKHSQRKGRRMKNRGGDRLAEWRILRHCSQHVIEQKTVVGESAQSDASHISSNVGLSFQECSDENFAMETDDMMPAKATKQCEQSSPIAGAASLSGRRIVDIKHMFNEIKKISRHEPFQCGFADMTCVSEVSTGLRSGFKFKCEMCNLSDIIWSETHSGDDMDVNTAAVAGVMSIGSGYSGLHELLGAMNIRNMSAPTYDRYHKKVANGWQQTALTEMKEAADEEIRLARERGDVDKEGVPLLTVVADGSWAKRSYRTNYSSMSGVVSTFQYVFRLTK